LDPTEGTRASLGLPICNSISVIASPSRKVYYGSPLIPTERMREESKTKRWDDPPDRSLHRAPHEYGGWVKSAQKAPQTKKNPETSRDMGDPKPMHVVIPRQSCHKMELWEIMNYFLH
jgi:hypothetical protein